MGRAWTVSQFLTNLVYHLNTVRLAALPSSCTCICTVLCTIQRCAHILLYWYYTENNHSDTKQIITWNRKYKLKLHVQIYVNERLPWIGYTRTSKTTYRSTHFLWFSMSMFFCLFLIVTALCNQYSFSCNEKLQKLMSMDSHYYEPKNFIHCFHPLQYSS